MALPFAIIVGMIAAIVVPYLARAGGDPTGGVLLGEYHHLPIAGGITLIWDWPAFCLVTLLVWGLLAVATRK